MSDGTPRPPRVHSSTREAAQRAHERVAPDDARPTRASVRATSRSDERPDAHAESPTRSSARRRGASSTGAASAGAASGARDRQAGATRGRRAKKPPRRGAARFFLGRGGWGCFGRIVGFFLFLGLLGFAALYVMYQRTEIPSVNAIAKAQVSTVYYNDGRTPLGRLQSGTDRQPVPLAKIPLPVQRAFLAAEDRSFYTNQGISPTGIARAVWVGARGGDTQGGSTITQQYVKNTFLTQDRTVKRKLTELFLAIKIDQQKSKDEILQDYLNTIYFGRQAYGIQSASQAFFDKDVSALTPAEGALLAAIVKGPTLYEPSLSAANKKRNTERATWILDGMVEEGWLPRAQRATMTIPTVIKRKPAKVVGGTDGYLMGRVNAELKNHVTQEQLDRGGLKVVMTIDKAQQEKAVEAVEHFWPQGMDRVHIGLAAVKPQTGEITAMYGGADYAKQEFDDAWQNTVPGASTFKVFTLTAAVEHGLSIKTRVSGDMPYRATDESEKINNAEGEGDMGTITLKNALAHSVNTAFARLNWALDPKHTADVATRLGITVPPSERNIVGNTLGQTVVAPVDMAGAYSAYANKGVYIKPHMIASVTADGSAQTDVDYHADTKGKQVIDPDVVDDVVDAMQAVITNGTATDSVTPRFSRPAAGKTGTGEDNKQAWFDGFTPQLTAAVAMTQRTPDNKSVQPMHYDGPVYGGGIPAKIWARFMRNALDGQPVEELPQRTPTGKIGYIDAEPKRGDLTAVENGSGDESSDGPDSSNGNGSGPSGPGSGDGSGSGDGTGNGTGSGSGTSAPSTQNPSPPPPTSTGTGTPSGTPTGPATPAPSNTGIVPHPAPPSTGTTPAPSNTGIVPAPRLSTPPRPAGERATGTATATAAPVPSPGH